MLKFTKLCEKILCTHVNTFLQTKIFRELLILLLTPLTFFPSLVVIDTSQKLYFVLHVLYFKKIDFLENDGNIHMRVLETLLH